jgi:hypothetical protein
MRRDLGVARDDAELRRRGTCQQAACRGPQDAHARATGRQKYYDEVVYDLTTRPGTPEAKINPTTHLTFSYATQVVILDEDGQVARVVAANDVGRAINPRCVPSRWRAGSTWASATPCPRTSLQPTGFPIRSGSATWALSRPSTCRRLTSSSSRSLTKSGLRCEGRGRNRVRGNGAGDCRRAPLL